MSQSTDQLAPGLQQTETEARAAVAASKSKADAWEADGGRFIREHGAQVLGGHADVGDGGPHRGRQA